MTDDRSRASGEEAQARRELLTRLLKEQAEAGAAASADHPFERWVNPPLAKLLATVALDRRFVRGEGVHLWDEEGRRYTDLVAMYGALPFGHHPAEVWDAVRQLEVSREPLFVQPSLLDAAGDLAARLVELAPPGLDRVTFTNSGAEAVEASIKLARASTNRPAILSTLGGFHGKTIGALSATHRDELQRPFGLPAPDFDSVPFGDSNALRRHLERHGFRTAAFLVEPIQGEGGMHPAPPGYLTLARELCDRHGVLLVLDEIQTGLGRTATMFACEHDGVTPDLLLLAKALGGGVVPIGAVLSRSGLTPEVFALRHSSTFGGGALACRAALATLKALSVDDLLPSVRANGTWLLGELRGLQRRHPRFITDVRGRGFMIGIELTNRPEAFDRRGVLADLAEREELAVVVCAYLLGVHGLRLMTTLNGARVLRVEPPLTARRTDLEPLLVGLEDAVERMEDSDVGTLLAHIGGDSRVAERHPPATSSHPPSDTPSGRPGEGRWACIVHPRTFDDYADYDPSLGHLSQGVLERAMERIGSSDDWSAVTATVRVASATGAESYGELIAIPFTAHQLAQLGAERAARVVGAAVARARDRGAKIVGLGGFTSIVTGNGVSVADLGVPVTTGNALTAVVTAQGLEAAVTRSGARPESLSVGIVGATGSIGGTIAFLLSASAERLCLVGNPRRPERSLTVLKKVADDLLRRLDRLTRLGRAPANGSLAADALKLPPGERLTNLLADGRLVLTVEAEALRACPAVVVATSDARRFLGPDCLHDGAVVCDTSEPSNVHPDVLRLRPDVRVEQGGLLRLPGGVDLGSSLPLPAGLAYACISEAVLLALEHTETHGTLGGRMDEGLLARVDALARRHGFQPAYLPRRLRPVIRTNVSEA